MKRLSSTNQNSNPLVNVPDPSADQDAATKAYSDTKVPKTDMRNFDRFTRTPNGFNVTLTNAIQGVTYDGTHYYVSTKSHLYKYNSGGTLVTSHANSGDPNTHKYLGDMVAVDGKLYVASANFDGSPGTFNTYVVEFNTSDLSYVTQRQISTTDRCDSITYHDGYFWCPMYGKTIRQFDSSWNFVAEYTMPIGNWEVDPSANGIGFDGATWIGNYFILNPHEGIYPDCAYALYWNGESFERVTQIERPSYCTQGLQYDPATNVVIAAERAATSRVVLMNIRTDIPAISEWKVLRRTVLESASDTISAINIPNRRHLRIVVITTPTGGTTNVALRFNNDSGAKYSRIRSINLAAGTTALSATSLGISATKDDAQLVTAEILNIQGFSKVINAESVQHDGNSAALEPTKISVGGKYADTSSVIDRIDVINSAGTGDYAAGSELVVYGRQ